MDDNRKAVVVVALMRHGEKDGDALTERGRKQIEAACEALGQILSFDRVLTSGARRTAQCGEIAIDTLSSSLRAEVNDGLMFLETMNMVYGENATKKCLDEVAEVRMAGGGLISALEMSEYARRGRKVLTDAIIALAADMRAKGETTILGFSHSPWCELAAEPDTTPYGLGETDTVLYFVQGDAIIGSVVIPGPLGGKTN